MRDNGNVPTPAASRPSFRDALRFWLKLGFISFGGPAGQIAIMQTELVDHRRWIDQRSFLRGLNFCTLLPGPEATQLATYIGWRLHGILGGVAAGALFVLPGALVLLVLSWIAARHGDTGAVGAVFYGLKPVVIAIIAQAVWRIGSRALKSWPAVVLAAGAFIAINIVGIDFPWIVLAAAIIGWLAGRRPGPSPFVSGGHGGDAATEAAALPSTDGGRPLRRLFRLLALFAVLWAVPVGLALWLLGSEPFVNIANLFTTAAFVTFGGAYAVLPYVADAAVNKYAWLSSGDMLNGLALAETTPGPLILVLQYVGFFAGWNRAGLFDPTLAAVAAAALTTYVTFLPSFLFIFAAAPYIESMHDNPAIGSALGAITAAVVGVVLNLAVFLATAVFLPAAGGVDLFAIGVAVVAFAIALRFKIQVHWLVLAGAAIGIGHLIVAGPPG
ncbi:MAG: chromate efflux transporter [Rhodospirillales bacterium]|nr:chromate efflux transporter [Rhodospirillales bacterium]